MQPIVIVDGVKRFQENRLVTWMLERVGDLQALSIAQQNGVGTQAEYDQILMLVGYSVSGAPLSPETRALVEAVEENPTTKLINDPDGFREAYRSGYTRAKYEALELIRELELK